MDRPKRFRAILACAVFPGTGHFMVGHSLKGGLIQVVFVGLLFYVVMGRPDLLPTGLLIPAAMWLYSLVDIVLATARR